MTVVAALAFVVTTACVMVYGLVSAPDRQDFIAQPHGGNQEIIDPNAGKPINFLVMGQDTREGNGNASIGGEDDGEHNADTTMVVQISADRSYINIVSIPRDSMVDAPSCNTSKGTVPAQSYVMFNSIFASGWSQGGDLASAASCAVNAVNALTGLDLQQFIVVDFQGLKDMIDAIGGVNVCIPVDTKDAYTSLDLKKGMDRLDGTQATQYARMRHGTGTDGSDIMRTTRQQYLVKELMNEALSKNLMTDSVQLYRLADSALSSLSISKGLASAKVLAGLAVSLKNIKIDHMYSMTVPITTDPDDPNRVVWADNADDVWEKLRNDRPLVIQPANNASSDTASANGTTSNQNQADGNNDSQSAPAPAAPKPDPTTGLVTNADGTLTDPVTGGTVDPEDGTIKDPNTGQYIGIANRYLNTVICGVSSKK